MLFHVVDDIKRQIVYASRMLIVAKRRNGQIASESLGIIYSVNSFK